MAFTYNVSLTDVQILRGPYIGWEGGLEFLMGSDIGPTNPVHSIPILKALVGPTSFH